MKIDLVFIPSNLYVYASKDGYIKAMDKRHVLDNTFDTDAVTTILEKDNYHHIVICVDVSKMRDEGKSVDTIMSLLTHEASHAVSEIFNRHGFNCDELRSYLIQYIYKESAQLIRSRCEL